MTSNFTYMLSTVNTCHEFQGRKTIPPSAVTISGIVIIPDDFVNAVLGRVPIL